MFTGPIPGESLTREPKAFPWERPPELTDPEEVMAMYLEKLNDIDRMTSIMDAIELGATVKSMVDMIVRSGISSGVHTIDVGMLVSPVIHAHIKSVAKALKIPAEDGFEDKEKKAKDRKQVEYLKTKMLLKKGLISGVKAEMAENESPKEAPKEAFVQKRIK